MTNYGDYFHCAECGQVVVVVNAGAPALVCCGQKMSKLEAKTEDTGKEKHVPVIVAEGDKTTVKMGDVAHPMTEEHHISFVEVIKKDGQSIRAQLDPTGLPEAAFDVKADDIAAVYEYCNLHGLWKA